jgi:hypothetical protein
MSLETIMEELGQAMLGLLGGTGAVVILIGLLSYATGF